MPAHDGKPLRDEPSAEAVRLWIDTHVHLHDDHDAAAFLDVAATRFAAAGTRVGVLCLTEVLGTDGFERLAQAENVSAWTIERLDPFTLRAQRDDGMTIGVIAGRQIRCDNGLEVVSLGRPVDLPDGRPLDEAVDAARASGGLAVLVYGVGKWSGARGRLIQQLIEDGPSDVVFGDNSGRVGVGEQKLLKRARALGQTVLVGSDPLRTATGVKRVACWGVVLEVPGGDDWSAGWGDRVVEALRQAGPTPTTFGSRVGLLAGIAQQIGVRLS
ncbi:MAG: hypothetical protein AAF911_06630 [Planctomycetota bacterium]